MAPTQKGDGMINRPDWINYAYKKEPDIEMLKKALENEQWLITVR